MKLESKPRVGVIYLGRRRPGFDQDWGKRMEDRTRAWLQRDAAITLVEAPEKAVDDASLRRALAGCEAGGAEAIALLQTTMGDGRLAPTLAQLWPGPLILWATPENQQGDMISSCSLVGTHCWASVLRQMGHAFDLVYGDPDDAAVQERFRQAVRLAATVRRLRTLRLGLVGGQAPGYFAMSADPFVIHQGLGAQVQTYSLVEFSGVVNDLKDDAVAADVAQVKALGLPYKDMTAEDLPMASRLYLAMRSYLDGENLDALTVRCWPEMANVFGQWPYLGIARLVEEGRAVACEGDADAALINWIGESLGLGRCYLSDWLEHDDQTITTWHIGAAPLSFCQPVGSPGGPRLARHFNIRKPAVIEATLREDMPVTITRLWRCDGKYLLTAREGGTIRPRRHLMATNGLVRLADEDPREWFEALCHEGMPHHIAVFRGHHRRVLERFARTLDLRLI
ncbi:MAG TPA: hypothetical protein VHE61_17005 [Opitutaceae bacterium]|nr:hypothetical protein [Opitutaceae bacterium]